MDHYPVLLAESLEYLAVQPEGVYIDATTGLGNHTGAIARQAVRGLVVANDRDAESLELSRKNTVEFADRIRYIKGRFSELKANLASEQIPQVDGLLADLGVSRYQLTDPERGFSLQADGPVDMRLDRTQEGSAYELVNFSSERELADLIYQLGEERRARHIARAIVRLRPIHTTGQLARAVESVVARTGRLHPATQTFMALRLAVNEEQNELDTLLMDGPALVKPGGRMVVITFMSLEDRKVKLAFQQLAREGRATLLNKHVIRPSDEECRINPASRSAKLRAIQLN